MFLVYDPIELSEKIREKVVQGEERKYYRFRGTRFYGGIATADCVGCNLMCRFCWSEKPRRNPGEVGSFYSPSEVVEKLVSIAEENNYHQARISGNEPTIGKEHLLSFLEKLEGTGLRFVLETNGILIGFDSSFARKLSRFEDITVRVSLKGADREQFRRLTGSDPEGFDLQLQALQDLTDSDCSCRAAVMRDFLDEELERRLRRRLGEIDLGLARSLEFEKLKLYPHVKKRLKKHGIIEDEMGK
ncbi:hypothetical protein AKJ39_03560 [candidate division MSBL1 archaeon SCGC-AAA259J03]|uniref:Radical SAM core domain-containing protein n=1 Tax=candidate division MSBL1 archaeon SCGC-AAA259J03 TaxID=1698269 RepID=A0A656YVK7_9EURY|nr:hypothetical protein AKJ39_03560 [candidate division MSBL1 archaeon SCGC-AAA259J03]